MSRESQLRSVLRHGERFVCLPRQGLPSTLSAAPTADEIARQGGLCHVTPDHCGFRLTAGGTLSQSASGACKRALSRGGTTNEWDGPRHLFIEREGVWRSYAALRGPSPPSAAPAAAPAPPPPLRLPAEHAIPSYLDSPLYTPESELEEEERADLDAMVAPLAPAEAAAAYWQARALAAEAHAAQLEQQAEAATDLYRMAEEENRQLAARNQKLSKAYRAERSLKRSEFADCEAEEVERQCLRANVVALEEQLAQLRKQMEGMVSLRDTGGGLEEVD